MLYILFTTSLCNRSCSYCGGLQDISMRTYPNYSTKELKKFMEGDKEPTIAFYGGEPLLNPTFIEEVMDELPYAKFVIQTNGTLIRNLSPSYWKRMSCVLISIDGRKEVNDLYRGHGSYDLAVEGARWLREVGFKGDIVARMCLSRMGDVYQDVLHLTSLGIFDHVHWQLDVIWTKKPKDFKVWKRDYERGLKRLVDLWLNSLEKGKVLGIVPFLGIIKHRLMNVAVEAPPCGAGSSSVSILTDRRVVACPIALEERWALMGDITTHRWHDIKSVAKIKEPCTSCSYFSLCGGRCLYTHIERFWGEDGFQEVCEMTKRLIDLIVLAEPAVKRALRNGLIKFKDLLYPPFNNTTELIP